MTALPGVFADPARPVATVSGPADEDVARAVSEAFVVGVERTFDQDPRFGLCVLAEIASRALSPAVNDPGTAIDVIGRGVRLLAQWGRYQAPETASDVDYENVWVPGIEINDMFDDIFAPIVRDGAALVEVQIRLQKAFLALAIADEDGFAAEASRHSAEALKRLEDAGLLEAERNAVRAVADKIGNQAGAALLFRSPA